MKRRKRTFEEACIEETYRRVNTFLSYSTVFLGLSLAISFFVKDLVWSQLRSQPKTLACVVAIAALLLLSWCLWCRYRFHRLPNDVPRNRRLKQSTQGLMLSKRIPALLWPDRCPPPLFTIAKDFKDVQGLESGEFPTTFELRSFKWGAMQDLVALCKVAYRLGVCWRIQGRTAQALEDMVLGMTGTDAAEEYSWSGKRRGIIAAGGGDTNPMSAWIAREYSQGYGGYPPLRFLTATSETMIASTEERTRRWFFTEAELSPEETLSAGLVFFSRQPRSSAFYMPNVALLQLYRRLRRRPVPTRVILAGLHKEGTQAACEAFMGFMQMPNPSQTYQYFLRTERTLPYAVVDLSPGANPIPRYLKVNVNTNRVGIPVELGVNAIDNAATLVVLGHGLRDLPKEKRIIALNNTGYLPIRGSCRIIDAVIRYTLECNDNSVIMQTQGAWLDRTGEHPPNRLRLFVKEHPNVREVIAVGSHKQNHFVANLISYYSSIRRFYKSILEKLEGEALIGTVMINKVHLSDERTVAVAIAFGGTQTDYSSNTLAVQTAILGLLSLLKRTEKYRVDQLDQGVSFFLATAKDYPTDKFVQEVEL